MSHGHALSIVKQALREKGMTVTHKDGEYRVNYRKGKEPTAYYTNDLIDAHITGHHMAKSAEGSADLLKERRLTAAQDEKSTHDAKVSRAEGALTRTQESLGQLGAGREHGE